MKKIKIALLFLLLSCNTVKMEHYVDEDLIYDKGEKTKIRWELNEENLIEIKDGKSSVYIIKDILSDKETVTFVIDDTDILFITFYRNKNKVTYENAGWYLVYKGKPLKSKELLKQF